MNISAQALEATEELAAELTALELHCANVFDRPRPDPEQLSHAIRTIWPSLIADAQNGQVSPHVAYLAALYDRLARASGIADAGSFTDRTDFPWLDYYTEGCGDDPRCEDGWVIAELFWGGYVKYLPLTLGWLLMNAIRVQQNLPPITPDAKNPDDFASVLQAAGPDAYDAENLRGLLHKYERRSAAPKPSPTPPRQDAEFTADNFEISTTALPRRRTTRKRIRCDFSQVTFRGVMKAVVRHLVASACSILFVSGTLIAIWIPLDFPSADGSEIGPLNLIFYPAMLLATGVVATFAAYLPLTIAFELLSRWLPLRAWLPPLLVLPPLWLGFWLFASPLGLGTAAMIATFVDLVFGMGFCLYWLVVHLLRRAF